MDIKKEREAYEAALRNLENEFFFATPFDIWLAAKREAQAGPEVKNIGKEPQLRVAFEQWAIKASGGWASFSKSHGGTYANDKLQFAWQALQALAVPEGFVLVPKKPTKNMINQGYEAHDGFFTNSAVVDVWEAMIEAQEAT